MLVWIQLLYLKVLCFNLYAMFCMIKIINNIYYIRHRIQIKIKCLKINPNYELYKKSECTKQIKIKFKKANKNDYYSLNNSDFSDINDLDTFKGI